MTGAVRVRAGESMSVAVVIPWRAGCEWRERALAWVTSRYQAAFPDAEVVLGACAHGGAFNRSQAILDGATKTFADVIVVADGDCWSDGLPAALDGVFDAGWAVPHRLVHRLSCDSTDRVLAGDEWRGLPLSDDNAQDAKPYVGNETGTLVAVHRDVLNEVPPDRRFVGWGGEDQAWAIALNTLVGKPWRGTADLVHLWHPPQPRLNRVVGNQANRALYRRYIAARGNRQRMRELLDEVDEEGDQR